MKINQGSDVTFTFMAKFSLALRDEKGKAEGELISVSGRFSGQKENQAATFNTAHQMKQ